MWGAWGMWSQCTVSCGGGTRTRQQVCEGPDAAECTGEPETEEGECNTESCSKLQIVNCD